MCDYGHVNIFK